MRQETLDRAIKEAERFIEKAKLYVFLVQEQDELRAKKKSEGANEYLFFNTFPKESGAVRRASMDLTRVLADLRAGR